MRIAFSLFTLMFATYASAMVVKPDSDTTNVQRPDSIPMTALDEVVVHGEKPQLKGEDGALIVDLPSIVKNKPVTNILEALSYLPGVTDNNGQIWLTGASDVTIILNGEPTNMPLGNLYQLLYSTPIDRLKNVEIMYASPAKYHAKGAVINVVLKTPRPLDGLTGQVRAGYNQAHYANYGTGIAATYAVKAWNFNLNYSLSKDKTWHHERAFSNHLLNGKRTMIEDNMHRSTTSLTNTIYTSIVYKTFKLTYNGQLSSGMKNYSYSSGTLGNYLNRHNYPSPISYHNLAIRYKTPFGMTLGGDYTKYNEKRIQHLSYNSNELVNSSNSQKINRYHGYIDMEHQVEKWQLNYGIEYQQSNDHSRQYYEHPTLPGFDGTLHENVADAYIGVQSSFDWGLSISASAKGEYYHNNYQHKWNFIPSVGTTYYKTPASIFQFNFTTMRVYPSYWELHGGTAYINEYASILGNPQLQPYISYAGQLNYILKQKYAATFYVIYDDKYSAQLPYQSSDELKLIYQTLNMDFARSVGLQLHIPARISYIWDATATINGFHKREKSSHFHDISFNNGRWIFYGELNNTFRFSEKSPISLTMDMIYITPSIQGIGRLSSMWRMNAGLKYQFGKSRCCELILKADDIFNRWSPTLRINHAGQDYRMKVYDMTRNFKLTFLWRFNGFKPKNEPTIDSSRFGTGR